MGEIVESQAAAGGGGRARRPGRAGGGGGAAAAGRLQRDPHGAGPCDAQCLLPVLADLQHRDVYHHLGPRLVQIVDQLLR